MTKVHALVAQGIELVEAFDIALSEKFVGSEYWEMRDHERELSGFANLIEPVIELLGINSGGKSAVIVGANAGQDVRYFPSCTIAGFDPCSRAIEQARCAYPHHTFECALGESLPIEPGCADVYVAMAIVGCSTCDTRALIGEMIRVLRSGGAFIFTIACGFYDEEGQLCQGTFRDGKIDPDHWKLVIDELRSCLVEHRLVSYCRHHPIETVVFGINSLPEGLTRLQAHLIE